MIRTWLLAVVLSLLTMAAGADPVARIVRLSGAAEVNHKPARLLQRLEQGDVVDCLSGNVGMVMIIGGDRYQLSAGQTGRVSANAIGGDALRVAGLRAPSLEAKNRLQDTQAAAGFARSLGDAADLMYKFSGWLPSGTHHFSWRQKKGDETNLFQLDPNPRSVPRPAKYRFSLFDRKGNFLWSDITITEEIDCSGIVLEDQTPYIWRIDPYKPDGTPFEVRYPKWGMVTFLKLNQVQNLEAATDGIKKAIESDPADGSLPVLLAATYQAHAVPQAAIDVLLKLSGTLDTASAREQIYRETSSLAVFFAGFSVPEDRPKDAAK